MPTLFFPDRDTLRRALASGVVPGLVSLAPARTGSDEHGRLWLVPDAPISRETLGGLVRLGVKVQASTSAQPTETVSCWQQLIPLRAVPFRPDDLGGQVLFELPIERLSEMAGEMRRLSRRPFSFRWLDDPGKDIDTGLGATLLLQVVAPPYFTLARTLERDPSSSEISRPTPPAIHAYVEAAPRVWVSAGYEHPLAGHIRPASGQMLLLRPERDWRTIADRPFENETRLFALEPLTTGSPSAAPVPRSAFRVPRSIPVQLHLKRLRHAQPAELWVFHEDAVAQLRALVRRADEHSLGRFDFAIGSVDGRECTILRPRPGKGPPPVLVEQAEGYQPALKLPNLFVPADCRLEPALRRDALRELLAPNPERITWLHALDHGALRAESVAASAFRPLAEWVEYESHEPLVERRAWAGGVGFAVEPFTVLPEEALAGIRAQARAETAAAEEHRTSRRGLPSLPRRRWLARAFGWLAGPFRRRAAPEPPIKVRPLEEVVERTAIPVEDAVRTALRPIEERLQLSEPARASDAQERCDTLEARFLGTLTTLRSEERLELWPALAGCYEQLHNSSDAAVCWLNALWERSDLTPMWAWGWLRAEARGARWTPHDIDLSLALQIPPQPANARALAAYATTASLQAKVPETLITHLNEIQAYLDAHEEWVPARGAWLARLALSRLAGGDVLGLARTRDRLLERLLRDGLSLELDTPSFLRFASSGGLKDMQKVRNWLTEKRELIHTWIAQMGGGVRGSGGLQAFGLDVETAHTRGYADLIIAWGLARFAEHLSSDKQRAQSKKVLLASGDPVHRFLLDAFEYRINQVEEGKPARGPLPAELLRQFEHLASDPRYRVEKLLEHSRILAPLESFDAYDPTQSAYQGYSEPERQAFGLAAIAEPDELAARIVRLLDGVRALPAGPRARIILKSLENAPRAGEAAVARALQEVPPLLETDALPLENRTELLEKGLFAAGHFDQRETVQALAGHLVRLFEKPRGPADREKLAEPMEQAVRALRRLGLRSESDQLLHRVAETILQGQPLATARARLRGPGWAPALRALLSVASGWYYAGNDEPAHAVIEEARKDLYTGAIDRGERTALVLAYARTLGHVPVKLALGRFEELFVRLKGLKLASSTDSHYNLRILQLVETVVRSIVHEDFTLGPAVRGWLDDDEFLVRQRIHRDLKALMQEQGV
jgi:hypothetical protein